MERPNGMAPLFNILPHLSLKKLAISLPNWKLSDLTSELIAKIKEIKGLRELEVGGNLISRAWFEQGLVKALLSRPEFKRLRFKDLKGDKRVFEMANGINQGLSDLIRPWFWKHVVLVDYSDQKDHFRHLITLIIRYFFLR